MGRGSFLDEIKLFEFDGLPWNDGVVGQTGFYLASILIKRRINFSEIA